LEKVFIFQRLQTILALNRFAVLEDSHLANTAADEIGLSGSDHDHEADVGGPVPVRGR
jgi:hypothetical protein